MGDDVGAVREATRSTGELIGAAGKTQAEIDMEPFDVLARIIGKKTTTASAGLPNSARLLCT